jgi:glutamate 5-kinase
MTKGAKQLDKLLVVKVGTSTMFKQEDGREVLDRETIGNIGHQVNRLRKIGYKVPIVSSGAVTAGMEATGTSVRPSGDEAMPEIQRLAAIGWTTIVGAWGEATGAITGGILLTRRELDLEVPEHDEALRTTYTLLSHGDIPIINENDAITHGELAKESFGQNDTLSAIYAAQFATSTTGLFGKNVGLVMLSNVDGLYADMSDSGSVIREIGASDIDIYAHLAGGTNGNRGKGGMKTKFDAAHIVTDAGVEMWIANGRTDDSIQLALDGVIGTHFAAEHASA